MKSKKLISAAMVLLLTVSLPVSALAATYNIADGDITVNAAAAQQTVTQNGTTVEDSAPVITGKSDTFAVAVNAEADTTARVTLSDVEIDASGTGKAAVSTGGEGSTAIELDGENKLTGDTNHAGLEKNNGGNLTISDSNSDEAVLTAVGGSNAAGIGGGLAADGSDITISGGTVNATGKNGAAGIGGGDAGSGSDIAITGGTVTAAGGSFGAGIGGGFQKNGTDIAITGGTVAATGGPGAAGIGGGYQGNGSDITITGGNVTAVGGLAGAAVGGGNTGNSGDITVAGSTQLSVQGEESVFDVSRLTTDGKILYYAPGADMKTDPPERILVGTYVPVPEGALSAPAYRVTSRDGSTLSCTAVQKDGVLTLTVNADFAILTGTLGGIETLKALGVEKLTFVTGGAVSTFALADLPEGGSRVDVYTLTHDGGTVTFTLGAENADLRGILESALG